MTQPNPCNCGDLVCSDDFNFRRAIVAQLCDLADGLANLVIGAGGGNIFQTVIWLPMGVLDTSAVVITNGAWVPLLNDPGGHQKKYVSILNRCNQDLLISFDGGTTSHAVVTAGGAYTVVVGETFGLINATAISVKALDTQPDSGLIFASAYY